MMANMDFPTFAVACGEEGSDPLVLHDGRVVRVDQYRASGHLHRLDGDLADVGQLGVKVWRYGMPWRLTEPEPGVYDWTLWDRALEACRRHGLQPVIDLCHFGLPDHYGGFCDSGWVDGFARYLDAFLARYPEPRWFTPVNEPGITALSACGTIAAPARTTTLSRWETSCSRTSRHSPASESTETAGGSGPKASAASSPTPTTRPASAPPRPRGFASDMARSALRSSSSGRRSGPATAIPMLASSESSVPRTPTGSLMAREPGPPGAGGVGDHERVSAVRLGLARIQIRSPAHHQPRHVRDRDLPAGRHGNGELGDRAGLVDHQPRCAMLAGLVDQRVECRLVVADRPGE
jgi:hypothetical protein